MSIPVISQQEYNDLVNQGLAEGNTSVNSESNITPNIRQRSNASKQPVPGMLDVGLAVENYLDDFGGAKVIKGMPFAELVAKDGLAEYMAENQSNWSKIGSALTRGVVGEIVGGTMEGVGYMGDIKGATNFFAGVEGDFGNALIESGKALRTWANETTPVYQDPNAPSFNPSSFAWWMDNAPSVMSTVSLMIPAGGAVKGLGALGKAMGMADKMSPFAKIAAKGVTGAVVSRYGENFMEAGQIYESTFKEMLENGVLEEEASKFAATAARDAWVANSAMLLQDIPQYMTAAKFFKAAKGSTKGMKDMMGKSTQLPEVFNKTKSVATQMLGEGFEEGYQFIVGERSKELALVSAGLRDEESLSESISRHVKTGDFWTGVTMGALGAGVHMGVSNLAGAYSKFKNKDDNTQSLDQIREEALKSSVVNGAMASEMAQTLETLGSDETTRTQVMEEIMLPNIINNTVLGNSDASIQLLNAISESTDETGDAKLLESLNKSGVEISSEQFQSLKKQVPNIIAKYEKAELHTVAARQKGISPQVESNYVLAQMQNEDYFKKVKELTGKPESIITTKLDNNITPQGKNLYILRDIKIPVIKNAIKALKSDIAKEKNPIIKESLQSKLQLVEKELTTVTNAANDIAKTYTKEDKLSDKELYPSKQELEISQAQQAQALLLSNQINLAANKKYVEKLADKEYVGKLIEDRNNTFFNKYKESIESASTIEELEQMQDDINKIPKEHRSKLQEIYDKAIKDKSKAEKEEVNYNEVANATETATPLSVFQNNYKNSEALFKQDIDNIKKSKDFSKLSKEMQYALEDAGKSLIDMDNLINELNTPELSPELTGLKKVIKEYFTKERLAVAANKIDTKEATINHTEPTTENLSEVLSESIQNLNGNVNTTLDKSIGDLMLKNYTKHKDFETNGVYVNAPGTKEGNTLINNGGIKPGDKVSLRVNFDDNYTLGSPTTNDGKSFDINGFRIEIWYTGKSGAEYFLGSLETVKKSNNPIANEKIRQEIYNKYLKPNIETKGNKFVIKSNVTGIRNTDLQLTVKKLTGHRVSRNTMKSPLEVATTRREPLVFGIATKVDGTRLVLEFPNSNTPSMLIYSDPKNIGAVWMLLTNPLTGEKMPFRVFTKKADESLISNVIKDLSKVDKANYNEIYNSIRTRLWIDFNISKDGKKLLFYEKGRLNKEGAVVKTILLDDLQNSTNPNYDSTILEVTDYIKDQMQQIDRKLINKKGSFTIGDKVIKKDYNDVVSDRLQVNLDPNNIVDNVSLILEPNPVKVNPITPVASESVVDIVKDSNPVVVESSKNLDVSEVDIFALSTFEKATGKEVLDTDLQTSEKGINFGELGDFDLGDATSINNFEGSNNKC